MLPVFVDALTGGTMDFAADPAIEDDERVLVIRDNGGTVVLLKDRLSEK